MTIKLDKNCKNRLTEVIASGLEVLEIENGMFLDRTSVFIAFLKADRVIPQRGKLRENLTKFVDHYPIIEFISEILSTELSENEKYIHDPKKMYLTEVENYKNTGEVAKRLVNQICSLPWDYTLSLKLPESISSLLNEFETDITLSSTVRIVCSAEELTKKFPMNSENEKKQKRIHGGPGLLQIVTRKEWEKESVYFQIEEKGFIGRHGFTGPAEKTKYLVRAFLGLGIALRLFETEYVYSSSPPKSKFIVHRKVGKNWEIDSQFDLGEQHSKVINDLKLQTLDETLKTKEEKKNWALSCFKKMKLAFSGHEKGRRILLASQWLFDGFSGQDELLNFIQTMVVLEILLGGKKEAEKIGLGVLLSNRCAYLIGKSQKQRESLLKDFEKIYDVRSQIVHRGKQNLTPEERRLFHKLRWMCRRVIQEEIELLKEDLKIK